MQLKKQRANDMFLDASNEVSKDTNYLLSSQLRVDQTTQLYHAWMIHMSVQSCLLNKHIVLKMGSQYLKKNVGRHSENSEKYCFRSLKKL